MTADLSALIARLEAAEVGSRELDALVFRALDYPLPREFLEMGIDLVWHDDGSATVPVGDMQVRYDPPAYSQSLDAALALAERLLEGWTWDVARHSNGLYRAGLYKPKSSFMVASSDRSAPALALVIAILRAKQGGG